MKQELEEGDKCPHCDGQMEYPQAENCSCHINPPCSQCTSVVLTCTECLWEEGDAMPDGIDPGDRYGAFRND